MGMGDEDDRNPDWQEIFKDSPGLMNKMEEFSELQMEGADVFMGSFAMLKMYPYFSEITNWFMPFFMANPQIEKFTGVAGSINRNFLEIIDSAPILCNSDKYSFCFSIENLPKENLDFLAQGMNAEISQLVELQKDEEITDPGRFRGVISNQYIQDLYRFYKLHPQKSDFEDVFTWRFDFYNQWAMGAILKTDEKLLRNIAEYHFKKNYFTEAAEIFNYLLSVQKDGELYQKLGYCHQKSGNYKLALDSFKKAELYDLNKTWLYNKIALCHRNLKQPKKALEYFLEVEKLDPENLATELNIGHCYLELGQFDDALRYYFKVEYLAPGNKKVWRPLGWCSFVTGKKEQAEKYFNKIIDDEPGKHDLMNMGHVQWCMGNRKVALDFYKRSISPAFFTEKEFFEVFDEDSHHLIEQGIDKDDVPIMLDQLRYFVEE
jgi:tetratricopeptide (TPR) repeat protein